MAQAGVIRDFMVALGFKTDNAGLGKMQDAMKGVELKAVALKGALLSLATGAVAAVRQTAGELDKLYFSSQRIGASVTNINAYGNAIAQMGGSAEGAIGSLESLAEKMRNSPGYESQINSLGVQTKDANGAMRDRVEVMKDLSGVLAKMPAYQANAYASSLGIDQNTLLAMRDGKFVSNMDKYQKIQKELGMNDDLAKSGNEFMSEYRDLTMMTKTGFQVIVMQAGKALIPVLRLLNQLIQAGIHAFSQLNPQIKEGLGVGLRFALLAVVFGGFIKTFGMIFKFIPMLKGFIGLLKLFRLAFLASPIGIILALAAAIALLYDDYKTWKEGGKSLFDWSKWTNGIDTIIGKIKDFLAMLDQVKDKVINFVQKIITDPVAAVQDVVETAKDVAKDAIEEATKPSGEPANETVKAVNDVSKAIVDKAKEATKKSVEVAVGVAKAVQGGVKGVISSTSKPYKTAMTEFKGGVIKGLTPEQTLAFANRVMFRENKSGKTDIVNKWGYTGKYQFGASALAETGFIDKEKLKKASKGVKNGSNAKAHKAFLADKSNWLIGDWEQYRNSHEMQDISFKKLVETNLRYGKGVHNNNAQKMMGFAMAAHLKGAGSAKKWYINRIDSKDGNGTRTSDYARFGEEAIEWVVPVNHTRINSKTNTNHLSNTHEAKVNVPKQKNIDVPEAKVNVPKQKNIDVPEAKVNVPKQKNIDVPEAKVNVPKQKNIDVPEAKVNVPKQKNIDVPEAKVNVPKQKNIDVPEAKVNVPKQKNIDVPEAKVNVPKQKNIDVPEAKVNVPKQKNIDVPEAKVKFKMPVIKTFAPPGGNPHKSQVNNSNASNQNVTIHQSFKTDMTLNGVSSPVDAANAVKRQQENQLAFMARGAQSVLA